MRVVGLFADEAVTRFAFDQYVNVWDVISSSFHCEAQIGNLPDEVLEDLESFFLEPTDETGTPIRLVEATQRQN